jgi:hypothetical protein
MFAEMRTEETGAAGDENAFHVNRLSLRYVYQDLNKVVSVAIL